ncbi:MAG: peptidase U32 family protein [Candidatus Gracilibacteria bacterium]|jgi:putative protease|nr:peptidase U32 family protein [Candidatus Gracilibacteria bacterium]
MKLPEILSPVGSFEGLSAAIKSGCDSVYFGVNQLNMRVRSSYNFSLEELKEVAEICKKAGIKSFITLNVVLYNHDLSQMRKVIDTAKEAGIGAIISQDMAAIIYANSVGIGVHASTQLSISNIDSVRFYAKFVDTIVLAREVDLKQIKEICSKCREENILGKSGRPIEIEVFIHGALCVAQSGRCQMSLLQSNTSAQRGACLQECRKKYIITDEETGVQLGVDGSYVMSPKDLCTLPFLDKIIETGVATLKIEGRARNPLYVSVVTKVYKDALKAISEGKFDDAFIEKGMAELNSVYNRGFCDGYYLGMALPEWTNARGNVAKDELIYSGKVVHFFPKVSIVEILPEAHKIEDGDNYVITGKTTGVLKGVVSGLKYDEETKTVTFKVDERVRLNDQVYILKERKND